MGIKRIVDVQFWNDDKVLEYFSPEDKLFMLYLMTNPHTTQLGIYPINKKHMSFELGYTIDVINVLLDRFENKYKMIKYSNETKEIAIKNYLRHSIIKGGAPVRDCLIKELKQVKDKTLISYVFGNIKGSSTLNMTVTKLIEEYEKENGELAYCNSKEKSNKKENDINNDNENDNDNEVSLYESSNESFDILLIEEAERFGIKITSKMTEEKLKKLITEKKLEIEFNILWKDYPNKQGKPKAMKYYMDARIKDNVRYEDVLNGLQRYLVYCEQNKSWYSPKNGSTWFNQKSWNDEYPLKKLTTRDLQGKIDLSGF